MGEGELAASAQVTRRRRRGGRAWASVLLAATVAAAVAATPMVVAPPEPAAAADLRPNIILISADDMRESDLRWMPQTRRLLRKGGVRVSDFISNHPLCCPVRAEILTGQYAQNNGVRTNGGPQGGYDALADPGNHVGAWLKAAGYKTAFVGKHLNSWETRAERQPGWTIFNPLLHGVYRPYGHTMFNNGRPKAYRGIHTSDLVGGLSARYIRHFSATGAPFFIWTSQVAPHAMLVGDRWVPPVPAARHRYVYPKALPPSFSDPSYNEDDVSDKPSWVQSTAKVSRRAMVLSHRARIRSLRSVDDQVKVTVDTLADTGELRNTYIFFISDNGMPLGEHRLSDKNNAYEPSLQVPLLVRGPGLRAGVVRPEIYSPVDLAPTFLALSGAAPGRTLDGRSMLPTLRRGVRGYSHYLIQGTWTGEWWWRGIRSKAFMYARYGDGFEELYDMARDPFQTRNVARDPAYAGVRSEYASRLDRLEVCAGPACQTGGAASP